MLLCVCVCVCVAWELEHLLHDRLLMQSSVCVCVFVCLWLIVSSHVINMHAHNKVTIAHGTTRTSPCSELSCARSPLEDGAGRCIVTGFCQLPTNLVFVELTVQTHGDKCSAPAWIMDHPTGWEHWARERCGPAAPGVWHPSPSAHTLSKKRPSRVLDVKFKLRIFLSWRTGSDSVWFKRLPGLIWLNVLFGVFSLFSPAAPRSVFKLDRQSSIPPLLILHRIRVRVSISQSPAAAAASNRSLSGLFYLLSV